MRFPTNQWGANQRSQGAHSFLTWTYRVILKIKLQCASNIQRCLEMQVEILSDDFEWAKLSAPSAVWWQWTVKIHFTTSSGLAASEQFLKTKQKKGFFRFNAIASCAYSQSKRELHVGHFKPSHWLCFFVVFLTSLRLMLTHDTKLCRRANK